MAALVIGYGNTLRGDDSVGYQVADYIDQLNWPDVQTIACHQLAPELAAYIAECDYVIFVDATLPGILSEVSIEPVELKSPTRIETHLITPETLMCLAAELYGRRPNAAKVLIPTQAMEFGEALSEIAQVGMNAAIRHIQTLLAEQQT
jgi:hydrogenase maturation protease